MAKVNDLFNSLFERVNAYSVRYIQAYLPAEPGIGPEAYELDVKAFCLLSHAAFEHYFEQISLYTMSCMVDKWINEKLMSDCLLMLLCRYGICYKLPTDDIAQETRIYDHVRMMAKAAKVRFSHDVYENHGISPKHLRCLLLPIAIEFDPDANMFNALCQLSKERGEYAHHGFSRRSLAPEDAVKYTSDCLAFAKEIKGKVLAKGLV